MRLLLILLGLCMLQFAKSQSPLLHFQHINLPDEVSNRTANCFLEDRHGVIWIGLRRGLARYNGYSTEIVKNVSNDGEVTPFNYVTALLEDNTGRIWVGTMNGVYIYDCNTQISEAFESSKFENRQCRSLYLTSKGEIVIGTDLGMHIYSTVDNSLESFIHHESLTKGLSHNIIRCVFEDSDMNLWVGTYNGLNKIDRTNNKIYSYRLQSELNRNKKNNLILTISSLKAESDSLLLVGTETGACVFNRMTTEFTQFKQGEHFQSLSNNVIKSSCLVKPGQMWLGTDWGLNVFNLSDNSFDNYFHDFENQFTISNNVINSIHKDTKGNVWIGTNNGIDKIFISENEFLYNQMNSQSVMLKGGISVQNFAKTDNGDVWMATNEGAVWYNRESDQFRFFKPPEVLHNKVNDVLSDSMGYVWIATAGGLNIYNPYSNKMKAFTAGQANEYRPGTNYFNCISTDKRGDIWLGTYGDGLYKVERENELELKFIKVNIKVGNGAEQSSISVFDIVDDGLGYLWMATGKGLVRLNLNTGAYGNFKDNSDDYGDVPDSYVSQIVDDESVLWFLASDGVYHWDYKVRKFNKMNQLPSNVRSISVVDDYMWLTTYSGLYRFDLVNEELIKIPSKEVGLKAFSKGIMFSGDNDMFIGGYEGFVRFNPLEIKVDTLVPDIFFADLKILGTSIKPYKQFNDRYILSRHINHTKSFELEYEENSFSIEFSSLLYNEGESGGYQYILDGYDSNWQSATQNVVSYTRVKPGNYQFKVRGANAYGVFDDAYRSIEIKVKPPVWATKWAIALYIVLFISLFIISRHLLIARIHYRNNLKFAKIQKEKSDELVQIKTRFFTNVSHELKTPLTLITSPLEKLLTEEVEESKIKTLQIIQRNTNRLIKLVNQVLDMRKVEKGIERLNLQKYNLVGFCSRIVNQYVEISKERGIIVSFKSEQDEVLASFDVDKMEKVINNLLSNAYKFTPNNGRIEVELSHEIDPAEANENAVFAIIRVRDTGKGISPEDIPHVFERFNNVVGKNYTSQEGTGIGLSLVRDYIELHNGFVQVESVLNQGSVFKVAFPLNLHDGIGAEVDSADNVKIVAPENESDSELESMDDLGAKSGKESILIVEDDTDMRQFISELFTENYEVLMACDGKEGWQMALAHLPDIIISDVMMPNMDGFQMCQKIKTDIRTSHIPLILLTAKDGIESKMEGIEIGADDYVAKPFNVEYLLLRTKKLVEQRKDLQRILAGQLSIEPSEVTVTSLDEKFLKELVAKIEQEIDNSELNVKYLCELMNMSHANLYRKIKGMTGQSTNEFIRTIRLKRAAQLLKAEGLNVTDVMYMVGFTHRSYFTRSFKEQFGVSPKEYKQ